MLTEKQGYQQLWLKYYNIVVDILREYKENKQSPFLFAVKVESILKNNDLIDQE